MTQCFPSHASLFQSLCNRMNVPALWRGRALAAVCSRQQGAGSAAEVPSTTPHLFTSPDGAQRNAGRRCHLAIGSAAVMGKRQTETWMPSQVGRLQQTRFDPPQDGKDMNDMLLTRCLGRRIISNGQAIAKMLWTWLGSLPGCPRSAGRATNVPPPAHCHFLLRTPGYNNPIQRRDSWTTTSFFPIRKSSLPSYLVRGSGGPTLADMIYT